MVTISASFNQKKTARDQELRALIDSTEPLYKIRVPESGFSFDPSGLNYIITKGTLALGHYFVEVAGIASVAVSGYTDYIYGDIYNGKLKTVRVPDGDPEPTIDAWGLILLYSVNNNGATINAYSDYRDSGNFAPEVIHAGNFASDAVDGTTVTIDINGKLSASAGAPVGASYVVIALDGTLTNERALAGTSGRISITDGGANANVTIDLVTTAVVAGSYGSATAVGTFTVDAYGRLTAAANVSITGLISGGVSPRVAYFGGTDSLTSAAGFEYSSGTVYIPSGLVVGATSATSGYAIDLGKDAIAGGIRFSRAAASSGVPVPTMHVVGPNHSGLTASSVAIYGTHFQPGTVTRAAGALLNHKENYFSAPTLAFASASTVALASTLWVEPPTVGANATFTRGAAITIPNGFVAITDGNLGSGDTAFFGVRGLTIPNHGAIYFGQATTYPVATDGRGQSIQISSGTAAGALYMARGVANAVLPGSALQLIDAAHTAITASTEYIAYNFNSSSTLQWATGALTTQRSFVVQAPTISFVGASTATTAATVAITGAPVAGSNATLTNSYALWIQSGTVSVPKGTSLASPAIQFGTDPADKYGMWLSGNDLIFGTNGYSGVAKITLPYGMMYLNSINGYALTINNIQGIKMQGAQSSANISAEQPTLFTVNMVSNGYSIAASLGTLALFRRHILGNMIANIGAGTTISDLANVDIGGVTVVSGTATRKWAMYSPSTDNVGFGGSLIVGSVAAAPAFTVDVQGTFGATGISKFADGTVGGPGISFLNDADSGIYRIGANNFALAVNGTKIIDILTTGVDIVGALSATGKITSTVAAGSPVIKFIATTNTPATTWTAGVPSNNPAGFMEVDVGGTSYYIPYWT